MHRSTASQIQVREALTQVIRAATVTGVPDSAAMNRRAFTIVELIAVLVMLSLIAGTAAVSLRANVANSRAELAIEKLQLVDRQMRESSLRFGRESSLQFDLTRGKIVRSGRGQRDSVIEDNVSIREFRSDELVAGSGQVAVQFLPDGTSSTYAVGLQRTGVAQTWIVFAGMTGKSLVTSDADEVEQLLRY